MSSPDWAPVFVKNPPLVVCGVQEPLDKLPPGGQLGQPGLHWDRGAKVVLLGEKIRAELGSGRGSVTSDNLPAVPEVVIVLHQAGVLPQPLQLVPVGGQQSLKRMSDYEEPSQSKLQINEITFTRQPD